jgi:serine/threonine-protein kinase
MLLTARSGELGRSELRDLRGLRQLRLKPLELADVEALVASMLSLSTDSRRLVAERLATESGGVPSIIVEKLAALVEQGQLVQDVNGVWQLASSFDAGRSSRADFVVRALSGRYTTEGVVSKGGVLTTYAAFDARAGRQVELHVPNRRVAAATEADHFMRIFERVATLTHPGIVPVVDYGATGGVLFFATPRVEGPSLRDRVMRERPLSLDESVRIAAEVARALGHAHARGVHHRDLRPKHIVVTPRGTLLGRLGLADALAAGSGPEGEAPDDTGVLIGSPAYLSPEQLAGETTEGARSDMYSLGCLLYEMLTGEPPFGGRGRGLIARKLTEPAPSVRNMRDGVPEELDQLVRRCLARMPADRYATADDLADALDGVRAMLSRRESPARVSDRAIQVSDSG